MKPTLITPVRAPAIGLFLKNQLLVVGAPPVVVDVSVGLLGNVDVYDAAAADDRVVRVSVSGSDVSLTGLTVGVTTVSVVATNSSGSALQSFYVTVTDGNAPRVAKFLPDQMLTVGNPPLVVNLASAFTGTVDVYDAVAVDGGVVGVSVSGSRASLTGLTAGATHVAVFAMNVNGSALQTFRVTVNDGNAPTVTTFLPDRVLTVGAPPVVVNVASAFAGDVDSYGATAGDGKVVGVSVSGSRVSLTGLTSGVTTVTVSATNANGSALQTFRVTVREPATSAEPGPQPEVPTW